MSNNAANGGSPSTADDPVNAINRRGMWEKELSLMLHFSMLAATTIGPGTVVIFTHVTLYSSSLFLRK